MSKVVILQADNSEVIHGVAGFNALTGNGVTFDPTNPANLALASGTRAFVLERDIVDEIPLEETVFGLHIKTPVKKGTEATARRVKLLEVEGAERIVVSGTGAITTGTAAQTGLEWNAGKLRVAQAGNEVAGYLRAQLTPLYPEDGTARLLVELL